MKRLFILLTLVLQFSVVHAEDNKRVLILYAGLGGHATAAKSIESLILKEHPSYTVIRHDFADETSGPAKFFITKAYDFFSRHASFINELLLKTLWWQESVMPRYVAQRGFNKLINPAPVLSYIESEKPDIIISTYFAAAEVLAVLRYQGHLRNTPIAWTHLDMVDQVYYQQIGDELDMSFVPTKEMAASWAQTIGAEKVAASGMPVMPKMTEPVDRSSRDKVAQQWGLDSNTPTVLLMGGSGGTLSYRAVIKDLVREYGTERPLQVVAICATNTSAQKSLENWKRSEDFPKNVGLLTTGFVPTEVLRKLQSISDLIISKPGGLSSFELLSTQTPVILTESIGVQENLNAQYLQKEGAALFVPKIRNVAPFAVQLLENPRAHQEMIENQQRLRESSFDFKKITDWINQAHVVTTEPPALPVLKKIQELKKNSHVLSCQSIFLGT
jgi:processive 1,2-diacylglycerol beta-glucosyltransferase